jgi:hypothetical protein
MILGIAGTVLFFGGLFTLTAGVLAIVFSSVASHTQLGSPSRGFAIAGLVTGIVAVVFYVLYAILLASTGHGGLGFMF